MVHRLLKLMFAEVGINTPLPAWYLVPLLSGVVLFEVLPYLEELWRARGAQREGSARFDDHQKEDDHEGNEGNHAQRNPHAQKGPVALR